MPRFGCKIYEKLNSTNQFVENLIMTLYQLLHHRTAHPYSDRDVRVRSLARSLAILTKVLEVLLSRSKKYVGLGKRLHPTLMHQAPPKTSVSYRNTTRRSNADDGDLHPYSRET